MGDINMKKIDSGKWLVYIGKILFIWVIWIQTNCMQLEYIEISTEEILPQEDSSSSALQIGEYELSHTGISYYEAILLCNEMSLAEDLDTLYQYDKPIFTEDSLFWLPNIKVLENRSGYRLPTKEEWLEAKENGKIEKLNEDVGEWLYSESNSIYGIFELAPNFLKAVGLYREKEGNPVYGMRVVREEHFLHFY